ncbi:MAG: MBL fold metallo-hydrolase [Peptococcaceae bacterium]|jgi:competence protein ComEC|nr:MBL fold metallo-hydrolase [Peptococcaceae bacterium]
MKKLFLYLILLVMLFAAGCDGATASPNPPPEPGQEDQDVLRVHYIDVGQGDATFIEFPNGQTMLIDAGDTGYGNTVAKYIQDSGHTSLDYIVATHPHADHIGGMDTVLDAIEVGDIYMPKAVAATRTYENLLDKIAAKGLKIKTARVGVNILADSGLSADILAPNAEEYSDLNNYSAVVMITYEDVKLLFMGDAEMLSENELSGDIRADVIKVGHHGSDYSSGQSFVDRVKARYAVISVGEGNSHGHPAPDVIKRWEDAGSVIYRTDLNGTIVISSAGADITVSYEKGSADSTGEAALGPNPPVAETAAVWVLNTGTKKIHYPDCRSVPQIKEGNRAESGKTVAELEAEGFDACGICKPHD